MDFGSILEGFGSGFLFFFCCCCIFCIFFVIFAFLLYFFCAFVCTFLHFCVFFSRFVFRVCCERPWWAVPRCSLPLLYHYCDFLVLIATKKWRYLEVFRASPLGRTPMFFILFTFAHKKRFFFSLIFLCDQKKTSLRRTAICSAFLATQKCRY